MEKRDGVSRSTSALAEGGTSSPWSSVLIRSDCEYTVTAYDGERSANARTGGGSTGREIAPWRLGRFAWCVRNALTSPPTSCASHSRLSGCLPAKRGSRPLTLRGSHTPLGWRLIGAGPVARALAIECDPRTHGPRLEKGVPFPFLTTETAAQGKCTPSPFSTCRQERITPQHRAKQRNESTTQVARQQRRRQ